MIISIRKEKKKKLSPEKFETRSIKLFSPEKLKKRKN